MQPSILLLVGQRVPPLRHAIGEVIRCDRIGCLGAATFTQVWPELAEHELNPLDPRELPMPDGFVMLWRLLALTPVWPSDLAANYHGEPIQNVLIGAPHGQPWQAIAGTIRALTGDLDRSLALEESGRPSHI